MSEASNPLTRVRELLQELFTEDEQLGKLVGSLFAYGPDAGEAGTPRDKLRQATTWLTVGLPEGLIEDAYKANASWSFTRTFPLTGALPEGEADPGLLEEIELRIYQLLKSAQQAQLGQDGVYSVAPIKGGYEDVLLAEQLSEVEGGAECFALALVIDVEVKFRLAHSEITEGAFAS